MRKTPSNPIKTMKTPKKLEVIEEVDYFTKNSKFYGCIDNVIKTKKYAKFLTLINAEPKFRRAFNASTLKRAKLTSQKR